MNKDWAVRGFHVLLLLAVIFGVEGARLAWLQLGFGGAQTASQSLNRNAVEQRSDELLLDSGRGRFRDRNGTLITGTTVQSLAAFPDNGHPRGMESEVKLLADSLGVEQSELDSWLKELREPEVWTKSNDHRAMNLSEQQINAAMKANLLGVSVLPYPNRYPADTTPLHAIGFISQHPNQVRQIYEHQVAEHHMSTANSIGGAGLEKSLDRWLQGVAPTTVLQVTDATRRPLAGLGLRMIAPDNPHFPLQVTTTLDLNIQHIVEKVFDRYGIHKGAAVVLDASNADILSMVSLPRLDPYHVGGEGTDVRNHALVAAPPGSVFKTVTLAAALESGVTHWGEKFHCDGHYGKYGLQCWKEGGHGDLTLEQAYAESCNVVFAGLAERMDPAWLQITAERMGLGRQIGWSSDKFLDGKPLRLLGEEEAGSIFLSKETAKDGGVRTGSGIGQRDVRVTPLQAANMAVTILHKGRVSSPRIVKEIRYADGDLMTTFPFQSDKSKYGQIEPRTAAYLMQGMLSVVESGTAKQALSGSIWPLAGKSGTAELAGKQKARNDQWFIGYGPAAGTPRYAISVLIEDQPAGLRNRGATVFGAIMDGIRLWESETLQAAERTERR
ncbi:peptidoglycan D,D-transpeptidase FtsI family protein [Cohnella lupini]|uniref:Cell division protein FtsI/penicillin-binding protein 2 n=1 Tax=Cohnella lupini TaxID=1294267 RepID=A0A3D9IWY5_9BACL|nr:penicillin-binding protein 2 [Cohnella lupini]RED65626.1 cell division protein FtsI/penicillin-binding protein 2 [Cohnella lupini]